MRIDLTDLKEREVRECSFQEARLIVNALENELGTTVEGTSAIEVLDIYLNFSRTLYNRLLNGEFDDEIDKCSISDIDVLHVKFLLISLLGKLSYIYQSVELKGEILKYQKDNIRLAEENKEIMERESKLSDSLDELASRVESTTNYIEDAEHTILTHVLTLMGVFSAIITVILSMATTSSTWLNNADAADALLAFVIPNLVTVLAVIVLVALVFIYHGSKTTRYVKRKDADEKVVFEKIKTGTEGLVPKFGALFAVVLLLCFGIATYSFIKTYEPVHTRYVVTPLDYEVCVECDSETGQEYEAYRFMIENKEQTFPCSDEYLHNGNLHYCSVHGELE